MGKISVFNFISIDGYFTGPNGEIDWFHTINTDDEWNDFSRQVSSSGNSLIFGHTTYEMMKSFWLTPDAMKSEPQMAEVINKNPKLVFSKNLVNVKEEENWENVTLFHEIIPEKLHELKRDDNFTILGSGSIIQQFANLDLIDEYALMVVSVILGEGKSFFKNVKKHDLKLKEERKFKSGIYLNYSK
jgi:dihydrofolate reductase